MDKPREKAPGARGWIFSRGISLTGALLLAFAFLAPVSGQSNIQSLVEQAARPEVMFGSPAAFDSLLVEITAGGKNSAHKLLDMAGTPWAWQFAVIRRALDRLGDISRTAILRRLADSNAGDNEISRLLVLFEKLGRPGDESFLDGYLRAESKPLTVPALRCVASFGGGRKSLKIVVPLLNARDPHIRLTAVWALGQLIERNNDIKLPGAVYQRLRELKSDDTVQIGMTAGEILSASGHGGGAGLISGQGR